MPFTPSTPQNLLQRLTFVIPSGFLQKYHDDLDGHKERTVRKKQLCQDLTSTNAAK